MAIQDNVHKSDRGGFFGLGTRGFAGTDGGKQHSRTVFVAVRRSGVHNPINDGFFCYSRTGGLVHQALAKASSENNLRFGEGEVHYDPCSHV